MNLFFSLINKLLINKTPLIIFLIMGILCGGLYVNNLKLEKNIYKYKTEVETLNTYIFSLLDCIKNKDKSIAALQIKIDENEKINSDYLNQIRRLNNIRENLRVTTKTEIKDSLISDETSKKIILYINDSLSSINVK